MKKIYLLAGLLLGGLTISQAQTQRLILLEHFTQASCGPCAQYNPAIETLIKDAANKDKIVAIKYQTSWPGYDPMNLHNPGEVQSRVSYYSVTGVPTSVVDGNVYNGHPADWGQDTIDSRTVVTSPFEMDLMHDVDPGLDSIKLHLKIKATEAVSGANLVLHMAVVEEHISFTSAPGSNGEKDFFNVMKKMLPNANGTSIGSTFADGDSLEFDMAWNMANVYDRDELAAIAWIQNTSTKEVYQATFSYKMPFDSFVVNTEDIGLRRVFDEPISTCDGSYDAFVEIRNNGSNTLTSADISYSVNGGTTKTKAWTGSLDLLETDVVTLPISYTPGSTSDDIEVTVSNPNGMTDGYESNNTYSISVDASDSYQNYVFLTLQSDQYAYENSWQLIRNSDGAVIDEMSKFSITGGEKVEKLFVLEDGECYTFTVYDDGNDGFNAGAYYRLRAGDGKYIIAAGGTGFTSQESISWTADSSLPLSQDTTGWTGVEELYEVSMDVHPNPTNGNVRVVLPSSTFKQVQITNALGQIVRMEALNGRKEWNADVSDLESGVYFIRALSDNGMITEKLIRE